MSASEAVASAPRARIAAPRLFYWSVRRELWESRAVYIAPLAVAGLVLFGFLIGSARPPRVHTPGAMDATRLRELPYDLAAASIVVASVVVGVFYCLGALHNERRDGSILFWKSLPVSNAVAVLAKAAVPLVALPTVALAVTLATQLIMLLLDTLVLLGRGAHAAPLWNQNLALSDVWALPYGLVVLSLWYAPIYGWLLLVSAWARRTPILWALAPVIGLPLVEKLAFGTSYVGDLLKRRLHGGFSEAFATPSTGRMHIDFTHAEPLRFLSAPDLWGGLVVAAAFLAGAVWLRRRGEPI